jgi:ABC-type antimicrobial peptide transport system permease subunit
VTFKLSASKEVHKEAALFRELGASRKFLFGLYLLRALLLGLFAGVTGFYMIWISFVFLRLDIDTSLLTFSILMVSSATFVSELPALRGMD